MISIPVKRANNDISRLRLPGKHGTKAVMRNSRFVKMVYKAIVNMRKSVKSMLVESVGS